VVEPSERLLSNFKKILIDGNGCEFFYIKSLNEIERFYFETASVAAACSHVDFHLIDVPFGKGVVDKLHDLTVCLNVLDQCDSPWLVVEGLKQCTVLSGVLVLSCSYQWNKKHLKNKREAVDDINDYFGDGWEKLAEDEHEYKIRFNDRYSKLFLTHIVAYRKPLI